MGEGKDGVTLSEMNPALPLKANHVIISGDKHKPTPA